MNRISIDYSFLIGKKIAQLLAGRKLGFLLTEMDVGKNIVKCRAADLVAQSVEQR